MLNLATFNIFWYPEDDEVENERDAQDQELIARVLANLAPQVMVFQEILSLERLQQLLEQAGTNLCLRSPAGTWLASDSQGSMKITCAYDPDVLDLVASDTLRDPDPDRQFGYRRYPYALHLRHRDTGWEFTVVGVHFRSGWPEGEEPDDGPRTQEAQYLAEWLAAETGAESEHFDVPPTPDVLVMGDFNLVAWNDILDDLRSGTLHWPDPVVVTSLDGVPDHTLEKPDERWTTFLDKRVIDHVFTTADVAARLVGDPLIYAFDRDPALDEDPPEEDHWLRRKTTYQAVPYRHAGLRTVENLYRISDHRPLRVTLDPG